jgi:inner membrane protein
VASAITHAVAAAAIGAALLPPAHGRRRALAAGAAASVLPDADVVAFALGIPYEHLLGHRGLTHSLLFAAALAAAATWLGMAARPAWLGAWAEGASRGPLDAGRAARWRAHLRVFTFLLLAAASHGVLDAMTDGGLGVAFFAPLSGERYFFPWRPIAVSPISISAFFGRSGLEVLASEVRVVWAPAALVAAAAALVRHWRGRRTPSV